MTNIVRAEVKSILFWDGAFSHGTLESFLPENPLFFGIVAQIFVGEVGHELSDSFDLLVCSPLWFARQVEEGSWERFRSRTLTSIPESIITGSQFWFMRSWNRVDFERALQVVCDAFSPGVDWGTVASRIGRVIPWEFDYQYDKFVDENPGKSFPPVETGK